MLVFQYPTGILVVEALLAAFDGTPTHDVEAAALVLEVTVCTRLALDLGGSVVALAAPDSCAQVLMVVAIEALVGIHRLTVVDMALVAVALAVQACVLFR